MREFKDLPQFMPAILRELSEMGLEDIDANYKLSASYLVKEIDNTLSLFTNEEHHLKTKIRVDWYIQHAKGHLTRDEITEGYNNTIKTETDSVFHLHNTLNLKTRIYAPLNKEIPDENPISFNSQHGELITEVFINKDNELQLRITLTQGHWLDICKCLTYSIRFLTWVWINTQQESISPITLMPTLITFKEVNFEEKDINKMKVMITELL